ncbi:MAG: hypothetical protein EPO16_05195 [Dehalococcoidia bacterium]|nr:MAG: hypothetical protein EPO16_05195 [Dehalococcoidia bacterium]
MTRAVKPWREWSRSVGYSLLIGVAFTGALLSLGLFASAPVSGDERLVVADLRGHALVVIDPARPDEARRISLPGGPHELLQMPDGRIAVSLEQSGAVAIVDIESGAIESLETGGLPHGLALQRTLEGDRLLVTDREHDAVRRFAVGSAASTWNELEAIAVAGWPHAVVAGSGGSVAVARARDSMLSMDGRDIAVSALPETLALAPDGDRFATAGAMGGAVQIVNRDGSVEQDVPVGGRPVRAAFSPDGALVAVALSASSEVALVDRAGGVRRVVVAGTPDGLAFSTDRRRLFAGDMAGGRVTVVEVTTGRVLAVIGAGVSAGSLIVLDRAR